LIAAACGFDRQVLYKNPAAKALLDEVAGRNAGTTAVLPLSEKQANEADRPDPRDRRIQRLEQENASLRVELAALRDRLRNLRHVESHMVETGRWVLPSDPSLGGTGA
jgi:hypothetical protein